MTVDLKEVDRDKIYHEGQIKKLGSYWIGNDLTFGIHIPVETYNQGKLIMDEIEKLKKETKQLMKERDEYKKCKQYWYDKYHEIKTRTDERKNKGKYTKLAGGHRTNSCEFDVHGFKCQHGDCTCTCHESDKILIKMQEHFKKINEMCSLRELDGFDTLHMEDVREILEGVPNDVQSL